MIALSLAEIAMSTGGRLVDAPTPDTPVSGPVVVDSRQATHGALFVAVRGEHVDGHDYAPAAVAAGAVGALATRPVGVPAILVDDVVEALGMLARTVVDRLPDVTVVGVTGSSGKTSTKDLLAHLAGGLGPTVAPVSSYNNEVGHPLTVLRADHGTRYLVLEVSARGVGHIARLCRIAPPHLGVVLNVGTAHMGEFGSREAIAQAKGELVEALPEDGVAVLNADDQLVRDMAKRTPARVTLFGRTAEAEVRAEDVTLDGSGRPRFTLATPEGSAPVALRIFGVHYVTNALAVAAAARQLGTPVDVVAKKLSEATVPSRWRMEVTERPDGVTVVNDAYNANPESMRAALESLASMGRGRRTWAVLGQMTELGGFSREAHEDLGRLAARLGIARLVGVGEGVAPILAGAENQPGWAGEVHRVHSVDAAVSMLREGLRPGDVVLVKASRVVALERIAMALLDDGLDSGLDEGVRA
ncbi:MAG: UDP-N-acetylmuramoyl-tripeptide--D-alanyl-D-alanine ligase [Streptosporangiales bacterium]|nr:UDP-N-acetylmuramoyl-tripeptide--D-alanyl-D-alanine ligase [Streptosporangiales bacterium]